jgi:predicted amidophosphoribosyltransferase
LVHQTVSTSAAHEGNRHKPDELKAIYRIDEALSAPEPKSIGIVDDMLTAGAHFRAMKDVLQARFPEANIVGFFLTRRVFPDPFAEVSLEDLLK